MNYRGLILCLLVFTLSLFNINSLSADVTNSTESYTKFQGALGKTMKFFGGNKPVKKIEYYKDDFKRTDTVDKKGKVKTSEIIDLVNEQFITLNHKKKRYTILTFEEWRQQIKEAMERFSNSKKSEEQEIEDRPQAEWEVTVDVNKTGVVETVNNQEAEEVILTIIAKAKVETENTTESDDEEYQTQTSEGQMIVRSTQWMKASLAGDDEIMIFNQKLMKKLGLDPDGSKVKSMWDQLLNSYPQIGEAIDTFKTLADAMQGTSIKSETVIESSGQVKNADDEDDEDTPKSAGGFLGGFGKKMFKKDKDDSKPKPLLEIFSDILERNTNELDQDLFVIPEKYKLKK